MNSWEKPSWLFDQLNTVLNLCISIDDSREEFILPSNHLANVWPL